MNTINLGQYFKVCRACLSQSQDTFSLFNKIDFLDVELATVLSYFNINVQADDTYPDVICSACYNTIIAFYKFWKTYNTSQKILSGQLGPYVSTETNEITIIIEEDDIINSDYNNIINNNKETLTDTFLCPKCIVSFKFFNSLSRHMRRYHLNDQIICNLCKLELIGCDNYLEHYRCEHKTKRSKPETIEYITEVQFVQDETNKEIEEKFICPVCKLELDTYKNFSIHVKYHKGVEFPCNKCDQCYLDGEEYLNHYSTKHRYECIECSISFTKKEHYKKHLAKHKKRSIENENNSNKRVKYDEGDDNDPEQYLCPICFETIESFELFSEHVLIHDETNIKCNYCHNNCENSNEFLEHYNEKHKNECKICQEVFSDKLNLIQHIKSHNINEPNDLDDDCEIKQQIDNNKEEIIICPICKKSIDGYHLFVRHVTDHDNVNIIECLQCLLKFNQIHQYIEHFKIKHRFQCKKCDISYMRRENLQRHLKRHEKINVGPFICEINNCGKKYSSHYAFSRHKLKHKFPQIFEQEEKIKEFVQKGMEMNDMELLLYHCPLCNNTLDTISLFSKHMAEHKSLKIPCNLCQMKFNDAQTFIKHYKTRHRFQCKTCDASYNRKDSLLRHMSKHDSNSSQIFYCPVEGCNRKYQSIHALTNHSYIHDKKLNFTCNICKESFLTPDALRHHRKSKHETPRHLCVHCGRAFVAISHLKDHMWQHTGVKPFVCDRCGRDFTRKQQMVKHLKHYCGHNRRRMKHEQLITFDVNELVIEDQQQQQQQQQHEEETEETITEIYEEEDLEEYYKIQDVE